MLTAEGVNFCHTEMCGALQSFGLNVARMAHIPADVVARAAVKAQAMRDSVEQGDAAGERPAYGRPPMDTAGHGLVPRALAMWQALQDACTSTPSAEQPGDRMLQALLDLQQREAI